MRPSDLDFAAECTAREGWASETRQEFEGFLAYDPHGCFIAAEGERRLGICVATYYGRIGFVGELIVVEAVRGRGIGKQLLEHAVQYLQNRGAQTIFLDGVPAAVPLYERIGFCRVCRSLRFCGKLQGRSYPWVRAMRAEDTLAVADLDRRAFGADRRFFLERRLNLFPELCLVSEREGKISAFIMGRRGHSQISAGPWVVSPGVKRPGDLLESLALKVGNDDLSLGVLETNAEAVATLRAFGLTEHPMPPWRMALGRSSPHPSQSVGSPTQCFAIGSPAKG